MVKNHQPGSRGSLLVEHLTNDPEIKGPNPASAWHPREMLNNHQPASSSSTFAEHLTSDPEIKCPNPGNAWHPRENCGEKKIKKIQFIFEL